MLDRPVGLNSGLGAYVLENKEESQERVGEIVCVTGLEDETSVLDNNIILY